LSEINRQHDTSSTPGESLITAGRELLIPEHDVWVEHPSDEHADEIADLYRQAYLRNDFFAGRYEQPDDEIFNPMWLKKDFKNPDHKWFVFSDNDGQVIGVTGLFHDYNIDGLPILTSDETQIAPEGRGKHIMDNFFRLVVPRVEATGNLLATSFVLTPETKGLRRTLEAELGMFSLGILPHVLKHPDSGITRSEIVSAKFKEFQQQPVTLLANFEPLYRIVQSQIPQLPEPLVLPSEKSGTPSFAENYEESPQPASGSEPEQQQHLLHAGFKPVAYYPRFNSFVMAKFPRPVPELEFILKNESIEPNKDLVRYLQEVLYNDIERSE
jgi:RimJ/RimL family protein N-acetyltransferase